MIMGKSPRAGWALVLVALAVGVGLPVAVWAPYHQPPPPPPEQEPEAQVVTIELGNFYFEGPVGRSDSADEPKGVGRLKHAAGAAWVAPLVRARRRRSGPRPIRVP